jgi:hypothetical protein
MSQRTTTDIAALQDRSCRVAASSGCLAGLVCATAVALWSTELSGAPLLLGAFLAAGSALGTRLGLAASELSAFLRYGPWRDAHVHFGGLLRWLLDPAELAAWHSDPDRLLAWRRYRAHLFVRRARMLGRWHPLWILATENALVTARLVRELRRRAHELSA